MRHGYARVIDAPDGHEIGVCLCGWQSLPRWREDAGRLAAVRHGERQDIFDAVGRAAPRTKTRGISYQDIAA